MIGRKLLLLPTLACVLGGASLAFAQSPPPPPPLPSMVPTAGPAPTAAPPLEPSTPPAPGPAPSVETPAPPATTPQPEMPPPANEFGPGGLGLQGLGQPGPAAPPAATAPPPVETAPPPAPAPWAAPAAPPPPARSSDEDEDSDDDDGPWNWITLAPKIGYVYFGSSEVELDGLKADIDARSGFQLAVDIALGGDGAGIDIVPLLEIEDTGSSKVTGFGGYGGLEYRMTFLSEARLYPSIGLGMKGVYLKSDDIDFGAELYGRIPLGLTYYPSDNLGFVGELGLGFGATGWKFKNNPAAAQAAAQAAVQAGGGVDEAASAAVSTKLAFGPTVALDLSLGIRFP